MKFNSFAFIFLTPGFSAEENSITTEKNGYRFKAVGIDAVFFTDHSLGKLWPI